jgi:hypothetical protein
MARDRKAALTASIQAEREASQDRVPKFDKFQRAEVALGRSARSTSRGAQSPVTAATRLSQARSVPIEKVIRDSFTMPPQDYEKIAQLRARCLKLGVSVTKGEVLRAGLHALAQLAEGELRNVIRSIEKVKAGRPGRI